MRDLGSFFHSLNESPELDLKAIDDPILSLVRDLRVN
jgi:hypothetical protein